MSKIVALFLILIMILSLVGCYDTPSDESTIVIMPDKQTAETLNGYKTKSETSSHITSYSVYYGNKNSKKYHKADCRYATSMKKSNRVTFNSLNDAINSGYKPCSVCHK